MENFWTKEKQNEMKEEEREKLESFWTYETRDELEELGEEKFWTPERIEEYRRAVNYTKGRLMDYICRPQLLEKIRWRDVKLFDIIYYRHSSKHPWRKMTIIRTPKRLSHRNLIKIVWSDAHPLMCYQTHTMEVHGKNFTRFVARTMSFENSE